MSIFSTLRAAGFLGQISRQDNSDTPSLDTVSSSTADDISCDIYDTGSGNGKPRTALLLHGITFLGRRDPRLMRFAATLSRYGVRCLVPELPGLATGRFLRSDVSIVRALIRASHGETHRPSIIVGFSFGGSYGLLAARDALHGQVSHIIAFGPYHSLPDLFQWWDEFRLRKPASEDEWDNMVYLTAVCTYGMAGPLGLDDDSIIRLEAFLKKYCHDISAEEKSEFYKKHLEKIKPDPVREFRIKAGTDLLEELSPGNKLGGISAAVHLIHDVRDSLVPPVHSRHIFNELGGSSAGRHRLLVTSLLSHVSPAPITRPGDLAGLCRSLAPLFTR